ncbi:hypothetical protein BBJ28_00018750 [Nothophytophthora sp. Chile5]|nr:hypothetical protein BBJ28_00018750 [Nothophytophthora sp. Chile5]
MMRKEPSMAAASGDPFYVFKECVSKVSAVNQAHAKWKAIFEVKDSPAAKELPALTTRALVLSWRDERCANTNELVWLTGWLDTEIESKVAGADKSLKFLEETIVMVEANRSKFEHIDAVRPHPALSRKAFVSATRQELQAVSSEISSDAAKARIRKEERKMMKSGRSSKLRSTSGQEDNERFMVDAAQRQQQVMQEQDQSLATLGSDITRLHGVTVEISSEVQSQNKCVSFRLTMLDDLNEDVEEAQQRMNFVMARMSKLLKTKGRWLKSADGMAFKG